MPKFVRFYPTTPFNTSDNYARISRRRLLRRHPNIAVEFSTEPLYPDYDTAHPGPVSPTYIPLPHSPR